MSVMVSSDWEAPGKKLQEAIAIIRAESPRRDIRGRFVHQYSPAEITLRALKAYAPPVVPGEPEPVRENVPPAIPHVEPLPTIPQHPDWRAYMVIGLLAILICPFDMGDFDLCFRLLSGGYSLALIFNLDGW